MDTTVPPQTLRVPPSLPSLSILLPSSRVSRHHLRSSCTILDSIISCLMKYSIEAKDLSLLVCGHDGGDCSGDAGWWHEQAAREDIIIVFWIFLYVCVGLILKIKLLTCRNCLFSFRRSRSKCGKSCSILLTRILSQPSTSEVQHPTTWNWQFTTSALLLCYLPFSSSTL